MNEQEVLTDLETMFLPEVADKHGVSLNTIQRVFKKHNPDKKLKRTRVSYSKRIAAFGGDVKRYKKMTQMRKAGKSFAEIGREFGISRQRAHTILLSAPIRC